MNEFFIFLSPLNQKTFQDLAFKAVKNRKLYGGATSVGVLLDNLVLSTELTM